MLGVCFREGRLHRGNIRRLEGARSPTEGPSINMIHVVRSSARDDSVVDEIGEGLERVFPWVLCVMVFRRDVGGLKRGCKEKEGGVCGGKGVSKKGQPNVLGAR